jgi:hypothetical protein
LWRSHDCHVLVYNRYHNNILKTSKVKVVYEADAVSISC